VYATDEGDIELHGVRQAGTYSHPEIMNQSLAQAVAQLILQKQLYNRNRYKLKLGQEFILLEPMDACTLQSNLAKLGLTSVRVIEIVESVEDYSLEITFEDNLSGTLTAPAYATQGTSRATANTNVHPGNTNAPVMFEAPAPLVTSATGYELWIYASGGEWWGGCNVWVSQDGNTYKRVGTVKLPARQGVTTNTLPSAATPDTTHTLGIDLSMSRSSIVSVSQQEADDAVSLCWISGSGNGEFISYRTATLTSQYHYNLSYMRRGVYGSSIMTHSAGAKFVRCDTGNVLKIPFNSNEIGTTYYVKFTSFNVFGTAEQELSAVSPYTFQIHGYNRRVVIESGTATITKGVVTTITYQNKYDSPPYPQVTITNAQSSDHLDITNMTTTSFGVTFSNNNAPTSPPETRQINYLIYGS
jgi:aryl carrier-like protein